MAWGPRGGDTHGGDRGESVVSPPSYTEADEHKIQHCFCYTSTVLTSTLAFQKEQKLKCECQVSGGGGHVTPGTRVSRVPRHAGY